jgi:undecaprenyl-phosphate 4-deoxy-4-formamido-L-arabinose transferase
MTDAPPPQSLSVVIPVYRSAATLVELHRRVRAAIEPLVERFEVIFVEDAGGDDSWSVVRELADAHDHVRGLQLCRNYGQHNALLCGIREARYPVIVTLDDDLQNPPEEIPRLLAKLDEGYDVVYGAPQREQHGLLRDLASRVTKFVLQNAMGAATARRVSAFRVFRTHVRKAFADFHAPYVSIDVLLTWGTTRFTYVVVRHDRRAAGKSNYTVRKLLTHAMNMMTGFSTGPLQFASIMGFAFTLLGFIALAYVLAVYLIHGGSVPGFAFLASMIAIFSGAQLFALGIIGEYLARMHFRTMDRPAYVVRDAARADDPAAGDASQSAAARRS